MLPGFSSYKMMCSIRLQLMLPGFSSYKMMFSIHSEEQLVLIVLFLVVWFIYMGSLFPVPSSVQTLCSYSGKQLAMQLTYGTKHYVAAPCMWMHGGLSSDCLIRGVSDAVRKTLGSCMAHVCLLGVLCEHMRLPKSFRLRGNVPFHVEATVAASAASGHLHQVAARRMPPPLTSDWVFALQIGFA